MIRLTFSGNFVFAMLIAASLLFLGSCRSQKEQISEAGSFSEFQSLLKKKGETRLTGKTYDLKGKKLKVRSKLLLGKGAKIINGTLIGENAKINCADQQCFDKVTIKGTWTNKESHIKWFTDGRNAQANYLALTNGATIGGTILVEKIYVINSPANQSFDTKNDLIIRGTNPKTSGFILETKHKNGNAYFRTEKGNNIHLKNISITTKDYKSKKLPQGNDYIFASCSYSSLFPSAQPNMSFFRLENCQLNGAVNFNYNASPKNPKVKNFEKLGIDDVLIKNCQVDGAVTTLNLSNVSYQEVLIESNRITNLYGPVFFFPAGGLGKKYIKFLTGEGRKKMIIKGNTVRNEKVVESIGKGYMSFLVAKGKDFELYNNNIQNVLNSKDGVETVPFYCSATGHLSVKNNKTLNVGSKGIRVGFGSNCLLKLKGSYKCDVANNEFRFNKKGLVALGLLKNENSDVTKIRASQFRFSIWGANLLKRDHSGGYYNFSNNVFEAAMISDYSFASRQNVTLTNNNFYIDYLSASDPQKWNGVLQTIDHTLFYLREPVKNATLIVKKNKVQINKVKGNTVYFIKDINDNKNFSEVIYQDNIFETDAVVSLAYPRSERLVCKNELKGKGSFAYNAPSTNTPNRTIKQVEIFQKIEEYKSGSNAGVHLKNFGTSTISTQNNKDTIANILQINFNDLAFYNDKDKLPIAIQIGIKLTNTRGEKSELKYKLIVKDKRQISFQEEKSGRMKSVQPYWTSGSRPFCYNIKSTGRATENKVHLSLVSNSHWKSQNKTGFLILRGLKDIKAFEITTTIENLDFPKNKNVEVFIKERISQ